MKKIAIIGAGPSGTSLCLSLLKLGIDPGDIVLFDRAEFPRPKLCGGAITYRGTRTLEQMIGPVPGGGTTEGLQLQYGRHRMDVFEPGPQWLYDRSHLDNILLNKCRNSGVEVREQFHVRNVEPSQHGWKLSDGRSAEIFSWVAGCDGASSVVRRASGLPGGRIGRLMEGVYEAESTGLSADRLYFSFDPVAEGIPGYGWIFPYPRPGSHGLWKIGVMDGRGVIPGSKLRQWTQAYAARNGFRPVDSSLAGWPEHYYHRSNRSSANGLLLIGETNGIDPLLGEGITPAIHHAIYAAGRIRQALDRGDRRIRHFESGFFRTTEGFNLFILQLMADRFYGKSAQRWLKILFTSRGISTLGESGTVAYGRFSEHIARQSFKLARQVIMPGRANAKPWSPDAPQAHQG